ncbi:hypothetical protein MG293_008558 [Ovis ammon polii]|uniref:Uncharacterized protein n=1 Tax=Ovis ammon polii TaxID=230172 RepID=A0AAD4U8N5_OVIAM|nr:hypothetical protein MG293_008558 [Ovis ammon polii]
MRKGNGNKEKSLSEIIISKIKRLQPNTFNAVRRKRSTRSNTDRKGGPGLKGVKSLDPNLGQEKEEED